VSLAERLLRRFAEDHPAEAAGLLGSQPPAEAAAILARLPEASAAALVARMAPASATAALAQLEPAKAAKLLEPLPAEQVAALLRRLDAAAREVLVAALPDAFSVRRLLALPEGTAGTLMDPHALAVPVDVDLDEARRRVGRHSAHLALELYVVDRAQRLVGAADLREVLDASRRGPLAELVRELEPLRATADAATIAAHPGWAERGSLPVVDERGLFLGALRAERLRRLTHDAERGRSQAGHEALAALGELYWLGLSGLFTGLAPRPGQAANKEEER
jgi:magnesium transporter